MIKGNKDYGYEYIGYQATQHVVCINNTDSIIETWGEPNSMEVDIINHHKIIKRDRKLNSLINDV